jgi:hypothetical protein
VKAARIITQEIQMNKTNEPNSNRLTAHHFLRQIVGSVREAFRNLVDANGAALNYNHTIVDPTTGIAYYGEPRGGELRFSRSQVLRRYY